MKNILAFKVAGIIFLFVALMHLARLILKIEVTVGGYVIPVWWSLMGFLFALAISLWIFKSLK